MTKATYGPYLSILHSNQVVPASSQAFKRDQLNFQRYLGPQLPSPFFDAFQGGRHMPAFVRKQPQS